MELPERLTRLERGERIVVAVQQRRVDFNDAAAPEIEVKESDVIAECAGPVELLRFLEGLPQRRTAAFSWWALDRLEQCSSCGRSFDTRRLHWALAVTIEVARQGEKGLIACWYPERFCPACPPFQHGLGDGLARH